jgi:hypothetical protein
MEVLSFLLAGVLIAFTGFGALIIAAVGSMIFAAVPAAVGWAAGALYKRLTAS